MRIIDAEMVGEPRVVDKPQSTRVKEPTLLCNHLPRLDIKCPLLRLRRLLIPITHRLSVNSS